MFSTVTTYGIRVSHGDSVQRGEEGTLGAFSASPGKLELVLSVGAESDGPYDPPQHMWFHLLGATTGTGPSQVKKWPVG